MRLLQLAITPLFAALIAIDGTSTSCDSGPSEHGKTTCNDDKDALKYVRE